MVEREVQRLGIQIRSEQKFVIFMAEHAAYLNNQLGGRNGASVLSSSLTSAFRRQKPKYAPLGSYVWRVKTVRAAR